MPATALRVTVCGRVQGVGFRDATVRQAQRLGVLGWVRNAPDGSVLIHAEGPSEAVQRLLGWLAEGPRGGRRRGRCPGGGRGGGA